MTSQSAVKHNPLSREWHTRADFENLGYQLKHQSTEFVFFANCLAKKAARDIVGNTRTAHDGAFKSAEARSVGRTRQ
jgi:hypothetical protein